MIHNKLHSTRYFSYCLVAILLIFSGCTHPFEDGKDYDPLKNFEALWQIIDERYCYLDEKEVDWDSVYANYYPSFELMSKRIQVFGSDLQFEDNLIIFDKMEEMLNQLDDGHVNLYSPFDISVCNSWYEGHPENFDLDILTRNYLKDYRRANGLNYCKIDNDNIGYVYYSSFSNSFSLTNLLAVLNDFADCKGIVIDVRNNGGGSMENAYRLASPFFTQDTVVGYWQHKTGTGHSDFSDFEEMKLKDARGWWMRPVVVLCNRHSYSAANFFVSMMQYADNCLILGGKSGGGGGLPMSYELPNGWMIRFSSVKMYDRDKNSIEEGITPHVIVNQVSKDKDDLIEKAIFLINKAYESNQ